LIEKSKDSRYPIDNVVINKQYAMFKSPYKEKPLGITNNKEGLPMFYSDIGNNGILLASSSEDSKLVPIKFDKEGIKSYEPCRGKIRMSMDYNTIMKKVNRVESIKLLLNGEDISEIDSVSFDNGILCGAYSDDWYVYIDEKQNKHFGYIDIDENAKKEMESYSEQLDNLVKKAIMERNGDSYYGSR
jgi:hypothetical protein